MNQVLHTLNRSPLASPLLDELLGRLQPPAVLLLIEDGVLAATEAFADRFAHLPDGVRLCVLKPDLEARGLGSLINPKFELVDDQGFVALTVECDSMQAWY